MLQYMSSLVQQGFQHLQNSSDSGTTDSGLPDTSMWVRLECALYAANVVVGRWVSETWQKRLGKGRGSKPSNRFVDVAQNSAAAAAAAAGCQPVESSTSSDDEEEGEDGEDDMEEVEESSSMGGPGNQAGQDGQHSRGLSAAAREAMLSSTPLLPISKEADAAVAQLVEMASRSVAHAQGELECTECELKGTV
jgi:hypothetical protein